jgi:hypothetical protein
MFRFRSLFFAGLALASAAGFAADNAADLALSKLRANAATDIPDARGVACMESVERTRYAQRVSNPNATCGELLAATGSQGPMQWRSRLRLDVTAGDTAEQFALTDASRFERSDIGGLLAAATAGSGEFSTFLRNLMAGDGQQFQSRGPEDTPLGRLLAFGFNIPSDKSRFAFALDGGTQPVALHGTVYSLPNSNELKRLTVQAENAGNACRVQYAIDYALTRASGTEIILPQSATMDAVLKDGTELHDETYYSGCRKRETSTKPEPAGPGPNPLPSGVKFRVRFEPAIDSATAATGDPVIGVIRTTVKDKHSGLIVHAGDRVHGRIALIEETFSPNPVWNIAVAFETIERGVGDHGIDQGIEQPVSVVPLDDSASGPGDLQKLRPANGAYYIFPGKSAVLDQNFETEWETR